MKLVHIFIQHSGEKVHFVHLISDFWQRKILWARVQIVSSVTTSGSNCPSTRVSLARSIFSNSWASVSSHNSSNVLKSPSTNPNLFNFFNNTSILSRLSALIKPDQAGEAYIKLEIILFTMSIWLFLYLAQCWIIKKLNNYFLYWAHIEGLSSKWKISVRFGPKWRIGFKSWRIVPI